MSGITTGGLTVLGYFSPLIFLGIVGFAILGLSILKTSKKALSWITFASLGISAIWLYLIFPNGTSVFDGTIVFNQFGLYFAIVMIISAMFITYPSIYGLKAKSEIFYATLLFVTIGMVVAAFSYNLITLFIAFESVSIGTYVLASFGKNKRNLEGTVKYFFTGTIATAFILFGASFFYIDTHTFNLAVLTASTPSPELTIALIFLIVGFGFKLAIFPMHQWAIDTYDGTENSVSAFLSAGSKVLAFVVVLKMFLVGFSSDLHEVYYLFAVLAILTMTYGNVSALSQNNMKRLLAYSSVAQAGYLILVLAVVGSVGNTNSPVAAVAVAAGMFYAIAYIFMKGGAFITMNTVKGDNLQVSDLSGLAKKAPGVAVGFSIMLLALAGIPLTGGFFAKYLLFLSLIEGGLWWLAVIAILNSAISVFYYFRIILYMFGKDPQKDDIFNLENSFKIPVYVSAFLTVAISVLVIWFPTMIGIAPGLFR
jgi:NADH-quinone oxidoreductase subunit N